MKFILYVFNTQCLCIITPPHPSLTLRTARINSTTLWTRALSKVYMRGPVGFNHRNRGKLFWRYKQSQRVHVFLTPNKQNEESDQWVYLAPVYTHSSMLENTIDHIVLVWNVSFQTLSSLSCLSRRAPAYNPADLSSWLQFSFWLYSLSWLPDAYLWRFVNHRYLPRLSDLRIIFNSQIAAYSSSSLSQQHSYFRMY